MLLVQQHPGALTVAAVRRGGSGFGLLAVVDVARTTVVVLQEKAAEGGRLEEEHVRQEKVLQEGIA